MNGFVGIEPRDHLRRIDQLDPGQRVGLVLFGGDVLLRAARISSKSRNPRWPLYLLLHGLSVGAFFRVSERLFTAPPLREDEASLGVLLWCLSGGLLVASLLPLFLPARAWRHLARNGAAKLVAGILVGLAAWMVGHVGQEGFWNALGAPTLHSVQNILVFLIPESVLPANGIEAGTQDFKVKIGSVCSGYEGIGLAWIFVSFYLWIARERLRFPHALWLLPIATVSVWSANILRIVALILIGDMWSPRIAIEAFHSRMGWILFCSIALGLMAIAERSSMFSIAAKARAKVAPQAVRDDQRTVLAFVSLNVTLLVVFWDTHRVALVCGMSAFYIALTVILGAWLYRQRTRSRQAFSATRDVLEQDLRTLRNGT